jgi:hypothetical protein
LSYSPQRRKAPPLLSGRSQSRGFATALTPTKEPAMNPQEIASRLAELCRQGQFEAAQKELFADDAVSIEPHETQLFPKETKGLKAILEKGHQWESMVEKIHGCTASPPLVAGKAIAMTLAMDVTMKGQGRMKIEEVAVYEVNKDGKIASEQFFM